MRNRGKTRFEPQNMNDHDFKERSPLFGPLVRECVSCGLRWGEKETYLGFPMPPCNPIKVAPDNPHQLDWAEQIWEDAHCADDTHREETKARIKADVLAELRAVKKRADAFDSLPWKHRRLAD